MEFQIEFKNEFLFEWIDWANPKGSYIYNT